MPAGAPPEPTLPSAKTFCRSFPPSVSVSNWKLEKASTQGVNRQTFSLLVYNHGRADLIKIGFQFLQYDQITMLFIGRALFEVTIEEYRAQDGNILHSQSFKLDVR